MRKHGNHMKNICWVEIFKTLTMKIKIKTHVEKKQKKETSNH